MKCIDVEAALALIFDESIDDEAERALYSHLVTCPVCCELFADVLLVRAMGRVAASQWGKFGLFGQDRAALVV